MGSVLLVSEARAMGFGLGAVLLWSTVATASKFSLGHSTPLALVTVATATSWLFFAGIISARGRWPALQAMPRRVRNRALALGLLNPALYYLVLFAAYDKLPAQDAMAINYSWGLTLALLAVPILGQRMKLGELLAAIVSYAGVFVIATDGRLITFEFSSPLGVALALLSTLLWSLYWLFNRESELDAIDGLFLNFTGALPVLLCAAVIQGSLATLYTLGIVGGLYLGLFEMGISFILWLTALRATQHTARISTLIFLAPPLSLLLIWQVLGEPIHNTTIVGLALILTGLAALNSQRAKTP